MITEREIEGISQLADISITREELETFTTQFNAILEYFDILDQVPGESAGGGDLFNILRDDTPEPMLPQDAVLSNAPETEDGFIKAPRVM
jgi:aspartyl-tRNA(Asn)/glutamyl-tRNA(Gln) amidotransferase subunit C